jgi:hypothetical protein
LKSKTLGVRTRLSCTPRGTPATASDDDERDEGLDASGIKAAKRAGGGLDMGDSAHALLMQEQYWRKRRATFAGLVSDAIL